MIAKLNTTLVIIDASGEQEPEVKTKHPLPRLGVEIAPSDLCHA